MGILCDIMGLTETQATQDNMKLLSIEFVDKFYIGWLVSKSQIIHTYIVNCYCQPLYQGKMECKEWGLESRDTRKPKENLETKEEKKCLLWHEWCLYISLLHHLEAVVLKFTGITERYYGGNLSAPNYLNPEVPYIPSAHHLLGITCHMT